MYLNAYPNIQFGRNFIITFAAVNQENQKLQMNKNQANQKPQRNKNQQKPPKRARTRGGYRQREIRTSSFTSALKIPQMDHN